MHERICSRRPSCELQFLQNKAVNRLDNFRRHTLTYKLYVALKKSWTYIILPQKYAEAEVRVCGIIGGFVGILFRLYQGRVCVVW
jgi:hypothetical protein